MIAFTALPLKTVPLLALTYYTNNKMTDIAESLKVKRAAKWFYGPKYLSEEEQAKVHEEMLVTENFPKKLEELPTALQEQLQFGDIVSWCDFRGATVHYVMEDGTLFRPEDESTIGCAQIPPQISTHFTDIIAHYADVMKNDPFIPIYMRPDDVFIQKNLGDLPAQVKKLCPDKKFTISYTFDQGDLEVTKGPGIKNYRAFQPGEHNAQTVAEFIALDESDIAIFNCYYLLFLPNVPETGDEVEINLPESAATHDAAGWRYTGGTFCGQLYSNGYLIAGVITAYGSRDQEEAAIEKVKECLPKMEGHPYIVSIQPLERRDTALMTSLCEFCWEYGSRMYYLDENAKEGGAENYYFRYI